MLNKTLSIRFHKYVQARSAMSLGRVLSIALILTLSSGSALATPIMWGIDEDDGVLFSINDYTQIGSGAAAAGLVSYGRLNWNDGTRLRAIGDDMEAFTLDANGIAYIALDDKLGSTRDQVLLSFDINAAAIGGDNVVTVLGRIGGGQTGNISGLSIDPLTGDLYALDRHRGTDWLLKISKTDGSLLADVGVMSGLGEDVHDGEDIEFDSSGNLYVTDNSDDELYRIDQSTGAILAVIDNHQSGGLSGCRLKIEALAWDPQNDRMVAFSDSGNFFADQTLENGNNSEYGDLCGLTDVEGMAFVPAPVAVPEPATMAVLLIGGMILPLRRKK